MSCLHIHRADGLMTVQDMGRPGHIAQGLSRGGAMDRRALLEAAALLGANAPLAALEMAGAGGEFTVDTTTRIALTGAPMSATLDGAPLRWNASHVVHPEQKLRLGGVRGGVYGYLTLAGGIASEAWLDSRSTHLTIGVGQAIGSGDVLPFGDDPEPDHAPQSLPPEPRFDGGAIRIIDGPHTALFSDDVLAEFYATTFERAARGNRQGIQLSCESRFTTAQAKGLASDLIGPGDVQMTGDGIPYILMAECQTVGGYPRIGTVLPEDLPLVAQAAPGVALQPQRVTIKDALSSARSEAAQLQDLAARRTPLIRDPATIRDLLSYQLVSGVTCGDDLERA
ncbi:MAG: biotin-dependent carboxyltransferase family protein [Celeribacter sp.]|jgi:biotin-dependent carboxylase-like uncharacterized protein